MGCGKIDIRPVLLGHRRSAHPHAGKVHSLAALQLSTVDDTPDDRSSLHLHSLYLEQPVVEENPVTWRDIVCQKLVSGGNVFSGRIRLRRKHDFRPLDEFPRPR